MKKLEFSKKAAAVILTAAIAVASFIAVPSAGLVHADSSGNDASGNSAAPAAVWVDPTIQQTITVNYGGVYRDATYTIDATRHFASVYVAGTQVATFYFRSANGTVLPALLAPANVGAGQKFLGITVGNPTGGAFHFVINDASFNNLMGMGFSGISINGMPFSWIQLLQFRAAQ